MTYGQRLRWKWVAETCWEELGKEIVAPKMGEGPMRGDVCSFGGSFVNGFSGQSRESPAKPLRSYLPVLSMHAGPAGTVEFWFSVRAWIWRNISGVGHKWVQDSVQFSLERALLLAPLTISCKYEYTNPIIPRYIVVMANSSQ